jgi:hypothetical protein
MLADESFSVLQDFVLGVEEAEAIGIHATSLLGQFFLHILDRCLLRDLNACGQLLNGLLRS